MNALKDWLVPRAHAINLNIFTAPVDPGANQASVKVSSIAATIVTFVLLIAGILAVVYLIYSGILYITAAGNPDSAKKGQQGVINAIIGIVIIVLAFFIARAAMSIGTGLAGQSIT